MAEEKNLVAYCGLYCGDCFAYQGKIADLARDLRKELRQARFGRVAESLSELSFFRTFKDYQAAYDVMGAMVRFRCKAACRGGGGRPDCKMRKCCQRKGIDGCWQCDEFETCTKLESAKAFHEDAQLKNLRVLRKQGFEAFVKGKRPW